MRRLVALFVIALLGATLFGVSGFSSGVGANGSTVSANTIRAELTAIQSTPNIQCYVAALDPVSYLATAGGGTISPAGAAAWTNLRVEGLAIVQYVRSHWDYRATSSSLVKARASLEAEMTQAATAAKYACPGSAAASLAAMPAEMSQAEVVAQDASLYLLSKLNTTIPLSTSNLEAYYKAHLSDYESICVSVALVPPANVTAFAKAQSAGESVASLARQFSADPSAAKGGAYGCYTPSSSSFSGVRADTLSTKLGTFPSTPQYISYNNAEYALFVAPTKRSVTPFPQAESAVLADLQSLNASNANTVKEDILNAAAIAVDPAFGRWGLNTTTGPSVFAPATPNAVDVGSTKTLSALTTAGTSTYK